jgi:ribosomal protein S18 acetylase RimI-like enzyme
VGLVIREASIEDAAAIAAVDIATHRAAYAHIFGQDDPSRGSFEPVLLRWQAGLRRAAGEALLPEIVLVAVDGDELVGYSSVGFSRDEDGKGIGEVFTMYVTPERWRQGIGHQLMEAAVAWLTGHNFEEASLWVLEENATARAFYQKQGWQADGARAVLEQRLPGRAIAEVRYRRNLAG